MLKGFKRNFKPLEVLSEGQIDDIEKGAYSRNIIVLLLTAKASHDPDGVEKAREFSHAEHLMYKPFEMGQLTKEVRELLSSGMEETHGQ